MTFPAQLISYFNSQQYQIKYDVPGTYQFTVPEGVSSLSAVAIGGGGGGAGSDGNTNSFTGGGGGGGTTWAVFGVQPGDVLTVTVGAGGTGGSSSGSFNGITGGTSSISIASRVGESGINNNTILTASGGSGGTRSTITATNTGGTGGSGGTVANFPDQTVPPVPPFCPIYLSNALLPNNTGGTGGRGGNGPTIGAAGGGGAGGYAGNGGNGGSGTAANPTAAVANSGGGGGGGGSANATPPPLSGIGYGGGGVGGFGFIGSGQGSAGTNNANGGTGASYFIDPIEGIIAEPYGQTFSITDTIDYPLTLNTSTGLYDQPLQPGDFLLLLSASDSTGGITQIPVPTGFTEISRSNNGQYYTSGTLTSNSGIQEIVPSNIATNPTRDLNFTTSFRIVPETGLSGTLTGLTSSSIHTIIVLRGIPTPISLSWATGSGDPGIFPFTSLMPNPPSVTGIPPGSVSIIAGFLANNILNAVGTAGANTIAINEVSGGNAENGQGVGLCASYIQTTGIGTTDPDAFLTGTAAHARAYSLQINKSGSNNIIVVGSAVTGTLFNGTGVSTLSLPSGIQDGDLLVYIGVNDNPGVPATPGALNGRGWNTQTNANGVTQITGTTTSGTLMAGTSNDVRGNLGGLGFRISYQNYTPGTGTPQTQISGLTAGTGTIPTCHMLIAFRNATYGNNTRVWDNGTNPTYGPPDPPPLPTNSLDSLVLAIGMVDNIKISNVSTVTAPTNYTMLAEPQSYGVQNNGSIIMTANRNNMTVTTDDPGNFGGNGGNIWVSQTIIISGPSTTGTRDNPGFYGGGGASMADDTVGAGMTGGQGSVRLIWGTGRRYPSSNQINKSLFDSVP